VRNPRARFHAGDLLDFDLGRTFDVVTCLFASITYTRTTDRLARAAAALARHVAAGGLLIVEPLLEPDEFEDGRLHTLTVEQPGRSVTRTNLSRRRGPSEGSFHMHYLVATPEGIEHAAEEHRFGLFTRAEIQAAFEAAGLVVQREPEAVGFHAPLYVGSR
jgi:SAM-dependent methyltransferase